MEPRVVLQNMPTHLCYTCKFISKCRRAKTIHEQLLNVEADALEKWKLDVQVGYTIKECDMYSVNWDKVNQFSDYEEYEEYEDDDDPDETEEQ